MAIIVHLKFTVVKRIYCGAVHKVRHAIFANFDSPPSPVTLCHTLSHIRDPQKVRHISRTPSPFLVGLLQKSEQNPLYLSQLFAGVFVQGLLSGVFCLEGFVRGGFGLVPLLSEYIYYNRKLNITLNFMFHIYDKKIYKHDVTGS